MIVVYDDDAYGAEVHHFGPDGADLDTVAVPGRRHRRDRPRLRGDGLTVRSPRISSRCADWLAGPRERPLVIDAKITSDGGSWWLHEAFRGH